MRLKFLIIALSCFFFLFTLKGTLGNPTVPEIFNKHFPVTGALENGPELGRYMHIFSLAENGTYSLTREMVDIGPDYGYFNGNFFAFFAPGVSYFIAPFYLIGHYFNAALLSTMVFTGLVSIINLLILFSICKNIFSLPKWICLTVVIIFGFGTTALSYETVLYQHPYTLFLFLSSFYAVWKIKLGVKDEYFWAALVWLNFALAIFIDYPNAVLFLPIMFYFLITSFSWKNQTHTYSFKLKNSFIITFSLFLLVMFFHGYHNNKYFGSWSNISGNITNVKTLKEAGVLDTPEIDNFIATKLPKKDVPSLLVERNLVYSFNTLFFTTGKGLFVFSPIFILAFWGVYLLRNKLNAEHITLLGLVIFNVIFYSSWSDPWGGWAYGPRYLFPTMAILSIFIGIWLNVYKSIMFRMLLTLLFIYSSAVSVLGALTSNQVRPIVEDYGEMNRHTYLFNINLLRDNKSSSFVYNTYLSDTLSAIDYYMLVYFILLIVFLTVIFILPRTKYGNFNK